MSECFCPESAERATRDSGTAPLETECAWATAQDAGKLMEEDRQWWQHEPFILLKKSQPLVKSPRCLVVALSNDDQQRAPRPIDKNIRSANLQFEK